MEMDIAPDGRVFFIERDGALKIWKPDIQQTVVAGNIAVTTAGEGGFLGVALAPEFSHTPRHLPLLLGAGERDLRPRQCGREHLRRQRARALHDERRSAGRRLADRRAAGGDAARAVHPQRGRARVRSERRSLSGDGRRHRAVPIGGLQPDRRASGSRAIRRPEVGGQHQRSAREDPAHPSGARRQLHDPHPETCSRQARRSRARRST